MRLDTIRVQDIRNILNISFQPDPEITVIVGPNGQGKTNLLESIWLLTGSKSFRGSKDAELIRESCAFGRIEAVTEAGNRKKQIELTVASQETGRRGRRAKVNGVEYGRATAIAGTFTAVVFEPGHLSLVKGGPEGRRRFLDAALCQLYPSYISTLRRYNRALTQKNSLLKRYFDTPDTDALLDAFDAELVECGNEMIQRRSVYLQTAGPMAQKFYQELASGIEKMCVEYQPCSKEKTMEEGLRQARPADKRAGFSTFGPHREDFLVEIDSRNARTYGSQGQQRSAVLSLKLAEAQTAYDITGEHPVMLLDDVLSELDETRQAYLLGRMGGKQCFVTTCDPAAFTRTAGKIFQVKAGTIL